MTCAVLTLGFRVLREDQGEPYEASGLLPSPANPKHPPVRVQMVFPLLRLWRFKNF